MTRRKSVFPIGDRRTRVFGNLNYPRKLGGRIQTPSATNIVNGITQIAAAVPWESGKRSLFSIFSMALYQQLIPAIEDELLHLDLESTVPHPWHVSGFVPRVGSNAASFPSRRPLAPPQVAGGAENIPS